LPTDGVGPKGNPIGGMNAVQAACSTTQYGMRRLTCMVWNLTIAGQDDDGNRGGTQTITEEQITTLREWIESSGADEKKFLHAYQIDSLAAMPAQMFLTALSQLKRKREQRK
jgi:hypothetical protein